MSDNVNQTNVLDDAFINIGANGSAMSLLKQTLSLLPIMFTPRQLLLPPMRPHQLKQQIFVQLMVSKLPKFQLCRAFNNSMTFLQIQMWKTFEIMMAVSKCLRMRTMIQKCPLTNQNCLQIIQNKNINKYMAANSSSRIRDHCTIEFISARRHR